MSLEPPAPDPSTQPIAPLFKLQGVSLKYDQQVVLDQLNLTITAGDKVALLGASGAGKSTLLNYLHTQRPDQCALCPQDSGLVDVLSGYHNIYMGGLDRYSTLASLWNLIRPLASARQEVIPLADTLGLTDQLWQSTDRLSGGQRQRVALGRALFRRCPTFLGDEPISALDPVHGKTLLSYVLSQHDSAVVCLHNPTLALTLFDRVVVLSQGRIVVDAPTRDLTESDIEARYIDHPRTAYPQPCVDGNLPDTIPSSASPEACVTGRLQR